MNIQMDCHFVGKSATSDDEVMEKKFSVGRRHPQEMPIKTSNLADKL
jgi:predicted small metal-binding protein